MNTQNTKTDNSCTLVIRRLAVIGAWLVLFPVCIMLFMLVCHNYFAIHIPTILVDLYCQMRSTLHFGNFEMTQSCGHIESTIILLGALLSIFVGTCMLVGVWIYRIFLLLKS